MKRKPIFSLNKNAVKSVEDIISKSSKAVCGISEREVVVPKNQATRTIRRLRGAGFHVIGTGLNNAPTKRVWFIRRGSL